MPSDTDTGFVYTLADPRTDEVRYVGATENPNRRFWSHIQNPHSEALAEWLDDLDTDDATPEMHVIDVADASELSEAEQSALNRLSDRFELLNQQRRSGYDRRPTPKPREPSTTPITNAPSGVYQDFDPTKRQRRVLDIFKQEYQVNPRRIREATGIKKQRVNDELEALMNAGWVEKRARGLYRLVYDGECYVEQTVHCKDDDPRRQR